jgi:hypothetical protein
MLAKRIEVVSNVIIIALAAVWGSMLIRGYYFYGPRAPQPGVPQVGQSLPVLRGVEWKTHPQTLVLALKAGCPACDDSMSFYRSLIEHIENNDSSTRILAIVPDEPSTLTDYPELLSPVVTFLSGVPLREIHVRATPAILLVDRKGVVQRSWIGRPSRKNERELLGLLGVSQDESEDTAASAQQSY